MKTHMKMETVNTTIGDQCLYNIGGDVCMISEPDVIVVLLYFSLWLGLLVQLRFFNYSLLGRYLVNKKSAAFFPISFM